jgi:hypothetical protein
VHAEGPPLLAKPFFGKSACRGSPGLMWAMKFCSIVRTYIIDGCRCQMAERMELFAGSNVVGSLKRDRARGSA